MNRNKVIGISRGSQFSPNHISNDAAIYNKVVKELQNRGLEVISYTEEDFAYTDVEALFFFGMPRSKPVLEKLKRIEDQGAIVINSAYGIENCVRTPMTLLLTSQGIPHPLSMVIRTDEPLPNLYYPCWLKRGNSHAIEKADVSFAKNPGDAKAIIADFKKRQIPEAVVNEHLQGDLVKFYGVMNSPFFHWFYPDCCAHSKFGLEKINGKAKGYHFDERLLKDVADKAASVLNVPIYGGDCVVLANGEIKIIDFNDWPSFACCRQEAGHHIADYIYRQTEKRLIE